MAVLECLLDPENVGGLVKPTLGARHPGGRREQVEVLEPLDAAERAELVAFFEEIDITGRMVILSGDAHMLAADDGTHSPGGIPVLQAAPLARRGSVKGGPYTHGPFAPPVFSMTNTFDGQFGIITVEDEGGSELCLTFSGRRLERSDDEVEELLRLTRCFQVPDRLFDGPIFEGPPVPDDGGQEE